MKYSVIDIEGTGGNPERSRIMEIAVYVYDDETHRIVDTFSTLVNPGKAPDRFVRQMTGISPKMLRRAPAFHEIAKRIVEMTENTILTAHNVDFDYTMLRNEFARLGYDFNRPLLDTVQLSRTLLKDVKNHGLDSLIKTLKIPATDRHRAFGDAKATVEILKILLQKDPAGKILQNQIYYPSQKNAATLRKQERKILDALPHNPGILKITDTRQELIYVVFTSDLRFKAEKILSSQTSKYVKLRRKMADIRGEVIYSPVIGKIKARKMSKELQPMFNTYKFKPLKVSFPLPNALLFDRGRNENEKSVILIENGKLVGYTFVNLNWQAEYSNRLKQRLTLLDDCPFGRYVVYKSWQRNYFLKILSLDENPTDID